MQKALDAEIQSAYPYDDREFRFALERILGDPRLPQLVARLFPGFEREAFLKMARSIENTEEFQARIIAPSINSILRQTSRGLTISGVEDLPAGRRVLFISNHRDIICDPALLAVGLFMQGRPTPKICLGDNLLVSPWITDLVKMNKGVIVRRGLPLRELMHFSHALSELIRREIAGGTDPVWIAQREGRAKDGDDRTHPGLLKMLALEGEGELTDRLCALHVVPVAISYEYDPCDVLKARELLITEREGRYEKAPGEDLESMSRGVNGSKGRIHIHIGTELGEALGRIAELPSRREQLEAVAAEIDRQIHLGYRLWPTNHVAHDLLEGGTGMRDLYTDAERAEFVERLDKRVATAPVAEADRPALRRKILEAYAHPVCNALALGGGAWAGPGRREAAASRGAETTVLESGHDARDPASGVAGGTRNLGLVQPQARRRD